MVNITTEMYELVNSTADKADPDSWEKQDIGEEEFERMPLGYIPIM